MGVYRPRYLSSYIGLKQIDFSAANQNPVILSSNARDICSLGGDFRWGIKTLIGRPALRVSSGPFCSRLARLWLAMSRYFMPIQSLHTRIGFRTTFDVAYEERKISGMKLCVVLFQNFLRWKASTATGYRTWYRIRLAKGRVVWMF